MRRLKPSRAFRVASPAIRCICRVHRLSGKTYFLCPGGYFPLDAEAECGILPFPASCRRDAGKLSIYWFMQARVSGLSSGILPAIDDTDPSASALGTQSPTG